MDVGLGESHWIFEIFNFLYFNKDFDAVAKKRKRQREGLWLLHPRESIARGDGWTILFLREWLDLFYISFYVCYNTCAFNKQITSRDITFAMFGEVKRCK